MVGMSQRGAWENLVRGRQPMVHKASKDASLIYMRLVGEMITDMINVVCRTFKHCLGTM